MISVGIDISKDKSMICFMKPGGEILEKPYEIAHSRESINELIKRIKEQEDEVRVIMEHTGLYHYPLLNSLLDAHIFVSPINGYRMKRYCSQSIRKVKNDRIDSTKIASYGLTYWNELECFLQPNEIYRELRALSRQYYTFTAMKVKAKVNVDLLITKTMPGIKGILQDNKCNHRLTDFVLQYVHYDNITKNKEYVFITRFLKWAQKKGFRMEQQTAEKIYRAAKIGIPIIPYSPSTKTAITEAIKMLYSVESSCNLILAQMQNLARQLPEFETVRGMQGVGDVLAPRIIAEIGDISRYKSKHSLIAYAGLDAPEYQSGNFYSSRQHISKRGNKYLRKTGYEIIQSLMSHKPVDCEVYSYILKKRDEGKPTKVAMIAGLNKFLRTYYGKVKEVYMM